MTFKKGDRVRVANQDSYLYNWKGTVVQVYADATHFPYRVQFDSGNGETDFNSTELILLTKAEENDRRTYRRSNQNQAQSLPDEATRTG